MRPFGSCGSIAAFLICFCRLINSCSASELIPSWKAVDKQLSFEVLPSPFQTFWTNSSFLRDLVRQRNTNALVELAAQQNPYTTMAAYFALRSFDAKTAQDIGLQVALNTSIRTNPLAIHIMETLAEDLPKSDFREGLTRAFGIIPSQPSNAKMLILMLPEKILRDWFEDPNRPPSAKTYEAIVLDRLYLETRKRGDLPTRRMVAALESYALLPGVPRTIFLLISSEKDPRYREALQLCLEDESLPDDILVGLVETLAGSIDRNIDLKRLNVSDERRRVLTDALSKVERRQFRRE